MLLTLLRQSVTTSVALFRITVPISIVTKCLTLLGVTAWLGHGLAPLMEIVGLPGEMGLVWATAMLTNLYGGLVVFASLSSIPLSVAQVTVLATMMLVAHGLPVELRIAQKAGPRFRVMFWLRIGGAFLLGWCLCQGYRLSDSLQHTNQALWNPPPLDSSWQAWLYSELSNMLSIFAIIFVLFVIMYVLEKLGITAVLTRCFEPLLALVGMSRLAAPVTIIGMTLGLSYGGSLIIQESRSGRLPEKEVFYSLALMGLCHSVIEDTLLLMVIGGHLSGILWARVIFSFFVVFLLVCGVRWMPDWVFQRYCYRRR
ncbi:MAG: hypothetical protein J7K75_07530 [Desulfuromonas sp.]|nr:hypothetical protein [Desulfuromonas sp.]